MGDIGDGDVHNEATMIVGRGVQLGMHGIVMILGVRRIDGDQGHVPPVFAVLECRRFGRIGFELRLAAEYGWNAMGKVPLTVK